MRVGASSSRQCGRRWGGFAAIAIVFATWMANAEGPFVAGVAPDRRPPDAPVLHRVIRGAEWERRALDGVTPPIPPSVAVILRDQGGWYTPFDRPGMSGPYDIRERHPRFARGALVIDAPAMEVIAAAPGWVCTRWTLGVPTIAGGASSDDRGTDARAPQWLCTQRTFLGAGASDVRRPDAVERPAP